MSECGYTPDIPADFIDLGSLHAFTTAPPYNDVSDARRLYYEAKFLSSRNDLRGLGAIRREVEALLPSLSEKEADEAKEVLHDIAWLEFKLTGDQDAKELWLSYREPREWTAPEFPSLDDLQQAFFASEASAPHIIHLTQTKISDRPTFAQRGFIRTFNSAPVALAKFSVLHELQTIQGDRDIRDRMSVPEKSIRPYLETAIRLCYSATYSQATLTLALMATERAKTMAYDDEGQRTWQMALDRISDAQATADFDESRVEWGIVALTAAYIYEAHANWLPDDDDDAVRARAYYKIMAKRAYKDGSEFVSPNHIALPFIGNNR